MKRFLVELILSLCTVAVHAVHYQVATGLESASGAVYSPDSLSVQPGDTIEFILICVFLPITAFKLTCQVHDITESPFTNPCTYMNGGIDPRWAP